MFKKLFSWMFGDDVERTHDFRGSNRKKGHDISLLVSENSADAVIVCQKRVKVGDCVLADSPDSGILDMKVFEVEQLAEDVYFATLKGYTDV